jgi:hypothetical protein
VDLVVGTSNEGREGENSALIDKCLVCKNVSQNVFLTPNCTSTFSL